MIYFVSNSTELFENSMYKLIGVEESLRLLSPLTLVGLDTETEGLDPYTKKLLLLQLGCKDFQVVIDCTTIDATKYKEYIESKNRTFIGWNLKFDLKFLFRLGIVPRNVYDGILAEELMWLGYPRGIHSMSLKSACETYLNGVHLNKEIRGRILWEGIVPEVIQYAARDVTYLEDIMKCQLQKLQEKDLETACKIENKFVIPLAYCEYCGIKLDLRKWGDKMKDDEARVQSTMEKLQKWIIDSYKQDPPKFKDFVSVDLQGDLWNGYNPDPVCNINWDSAKQVVKLFKCLGINTKAKDKASGDMKDSVDAKVLKPQKSKCSLIPIYLDYKEAIKLTSTYGINFIRQINAVSGRIHTNYSQLGADTTRITSGGKDKENKVEYVNLLNLPRDETTRACFVAEKGNKWISIDYCGQETNLMASIADDKALINELTTGSGDIHSLVAKLSYPNIIPASEPVTKIKKDYPDLRQDAKGIELKKNNSSYVNKWL